MIGGTVQPAEHVGAGTKPQDLSVPAAQAGGDEAKPGLGQRHYLQSDGAWLRLSCRHRRLVHPARAGVARVDLAQCRTMHRSAGGSIGPLCRPTASRAWRSNAGPDILRTAASRSGVINQRRSTYPVCEPVQTNRATSGTRGQSFTGPDTRAAQEFLLVPRSQAGIGRACTQCLRNRSKYDR